jgi:pimeloyl-ACP methyl ester carboxylesterase
MTSGYIPHVALVAALTLVVGILVYVAASFALMRTHTVSRPAIASLRAAIAETMWALVTQPMLPLFYFVGRRMGGGRGGVPVVMVHGYMQNRIDFVRIGRALRGTESGPAYGFNYPWFARVEDNAKRLARFVDDVCRERGVDQVDLVCHSLGGIVATEYLRGAGGARVRRCVTIASPHAGITWRGPIIGACADELRAGSQHAIARASHALPVPCLSIYSTHDNVVHPPSTSMLAARGGTDVVVDGRSHLAILFSREVSDAVVEFLASYGGAEAVRESSASRAA